MNKCPAIALTSADPHGKTNRRPLLAVRPEAIWGAAVYRLCQAPR
jgi:hypothetical protein